MLHDVTVDTNVFLHSANETEQRCGASKQFLQGLLKGETFLCIDQGFHFDECRNRSVIGCEYLSNFRFVDTAFAILVALGKKGKIYEVSKTTHPAIQKRIIQLVSKKVDRVFLKVSYNSASRVFVSHDFEDFQVPKRNRIRRELGVEIVEASDAL